MPAWKPRLDDVFAPAVKERLVCWKPDEVRFWGTENDWLIRC